MLEWNSNQDLNSGATADNNISLSVHQLPHLLSVNDNDDSGYDDRNNDDEYNDNACIKG